MANVVSNICLHVVLAPKPEAQNYDAKDWKRIVKINCGILRKVLGVVGAKTRYAKT
jgi:hypothetical protein